VSAMPETDRVPAATELQLRAQVETLEIRLRKRDEQRRAMLHIMGDLNESNKRLANQRKAMLHILADYEQDRRWPFQPSGHSRVRVKNTWTF
jgi:hypothetical protein